MEATSTYDNPATLKTAPSVLRLGGNYSARVAPSRSNPTGQVEYGPHGTISLYAPSNGGVG